MEKMRFSLLPPRGRITWDILSVSLLIHSGSRVLHKPEYQSLHCSPPILASAIIIITITIIIIIITHNP